MCLALCCCGGGLFFFFRRVPRDLRQPFIDDVFQGIAGDLEPFAIDLNRAFLIKGKALAQLVGKRFDPSIDRCEAFSDAQGRFFNVKSTVLRSDVFAVDCRRRRASSKSQQRKTK